MAKYKSENEQRRELAINNAKSELIKYVQNVVREKFPYGCSAVHSFNAKDFSNLPSKKVYSAYLTVNYLQNDEYYTKEKVVTEVKKDVYTTSSTEYTDMYTANVSYKTTVVETPVVKEMTFRHDNYQEKTENVYIYYIVTKDGAGLFDLWKKDLSPKVKEARDNVEILRKYEEEKANPTKKPRKKVGFISNISSAVANPLALIAQEILSVIDLFVLLLGVFYPDSMGIDYSNSTGLKTNVIIMLIAAIIGFIAAIVSTIQDDTYDDILQIVASAANLAIVIAILANLKTLPLVTAVILSFLAPVVSCVVLAPIRALHYAGVFAKWDNAAINDGKKLLKKMKKEGKTPEDLQKEYESLSAKCKSAYDSLVKSLQ